MPTQSITGVLESYGNNKGDNEQRTYSNIGIRKDDGSLEVLENVILLQKLNPVFRLEDRMTIDFFRPKKNAVMPFRITNGRDTIDLADKFSFDRKKGLWLTGTFLSLWILVPLVTAMAGDEKQALMLLLGLFTFGLILFVPFTLNFLTFLRYPKRVDMDATNEVHAKDPEAPKETSSA